MNTSITMSHLPLKVFLNNEEVLLYETEKKTIFLNDERRGYLEYAKAVASFNIIRPKKAVVSDFLFKK